MRIAIYARSGAQGVKVWDELRSQVDQVRKWAAAHQHEIIGDPYRDVGVGANYRYREGLSSVLLDAVVGRHFDAVAVTDMSRLSRDWIALARLRDALNVVGVQLICIHQPVEVDFSDLFVKLDKAWKDCFRKRRTSCSSRDRDINSVSE